MTKRKGTHQALSLEHRKQKLGATARHSHSEVFCMEPCKMCFTLLIARLISYRDDVEKLYKKLDVLQVYLNEVEVSTNKLERR